MVGLVAGILLGPHVMGRVSPHTYQQWFSRGADDTVDRLIETGASGAAVAELIEQAQQDRSVAHLNRLRSHATALVLAVVLLMVAETLIMPTGSPTGSPTGPVLRARLATARCALIAVWLALTIAQPRLLSNASALFVALLVIVALASAFIPLRKPAAMVR